MNRTVLRAALLLLVALASPACNKEKGDTGPASPAAPSATTSAEPMTASSLPPRAEEEQKANQEITPDNYKAQLEQLEKEIDQP